MSVVLQISQASTTSPATTGESCGDWCDVASGVSDAVGTLTTGVVGNAAMGLIEQLVADSAGGVAELVVYLATMWLRVPLPPLTGDGVDFDAAPPDPSIMALASNLWWFGLALGLLAIVAVGVRMVLSWRNGSGESALGRFTWVAVGVFLLSVAAQAVGYFLQVTANPGAGEGIAFLQVATFQWTAVMAVVSVMIGAIRTIWSQNGRDIAAVAASLLRLMVVSTFTLVIVNGLAAAFDRLSVWMLERATSCDLIEGQDGACLSEKVKIVVLGVQDVTQPYQLPNGLGPVVALLVLLIMSVALMIQMVMLLVRTAIIILMVGFLPLASSFTNTDTGKKWFDSSVGWLLAALLYKPVSAAIIATGIWMVSSIETDLQGTIITTILGLTVVVLSVVAAPALLRLCVPAVSQVASSGSGGMMAAAMVMSSVTSMFGGGGGGNGSGGGPQGATNVSSSNSSNTSMLSPPVGSTPSGGGPSGGGPSGGGPSGGGPSAGSGSNAAAPGGSPSAGASAGGGAQAGAAGGGAGAAAGAGAASGGAGAAAGAAGGGAAAGAAGGPIGMAVAAGAQKVAGEVSKAAAVVNAAAEGSMGGKDES